MTGVLVAETEVDLRARVNDLMQALGQGAADGEAWLAERRGRWIMGTPDEARERAAALEKQGTQRIMLQDFVPRDLDHVRLMGRIFARLRVSAGSRRSCATLPDREPARPVNRFNA